MVVLQAVASGFLGESSFRDGLASAALGLGSHFLIAFGAATVYYLASRKLKFLLQWAIVCGLLYGVAIYLVYEWGCGSVVGRAFQILIPAIGGHNRIGCAYALHRIAHLARHPWVLERAQPLKNNFLSMR